MLSSRGGLLSVFPCVAVNGGYFGAAAGVLVSLLLVATPDLLPGSNAVSRLAVRPSARRGSAAIG
jgi:hypothetical protein